MLKDPALLPLGDQPPGGDVVISFWEALCHDVFPTPEAFCMGIGRARMPAKIARPSASCVLAARRKCNDAVEERPKAANLVLREISRLYPRNKDDLPPLAPAAWQPS